MSSSHDTSEDKMARWVVALVIVLVLILCEIAYFSYMASTVSEPQPESQDPKGTVYDRMENGTLIIDEGTGESWVEHPDGSRTYLTSGKD